MSVCARLVTNFCWPTRCHWIIVKSLTSCLWQSAALGSLFSTSPKSNSKTLKLTLPRLPRCCHIRGLSERLDPSKTHTTKSHRVQSSNKTFPPEGEGKSESALSPVLPFYPSRYPWWQSSHRSHWSCDISNLAPKHPSIRTNLPS